MKTHRVLLIFMLSASIISLLSCITPRKGPMRAYAKAATLAPFDAVIIPGIPYNGKSWDSVMKARVLWSWILYKNGYAKNIIYSGGAIYTPYVEAKVMGLYGEQLGIPKDHIFYDTLAKHSTENVYYSYLLAQQLGFKSIALGTDPFQALMLRSFTRNRFESPIFHLPFVTDTLAVYNGVNPTINAESCMMPGKWQSIKEQEGFRERFRGTMGKTIDWSAFPNKKVGPLQP